MVRSRSYSLRIANNKTAKTRILPLYCTFTNSFLYSSYINSSIAIDINFPNLLFCSYFQLNSSLHSCVLPLTHFSVLQGARHAPAFGAVIHVLGFSLRPERGRNGPESVVDVTYVRTKYVRTGRLLRLQRKLECLPLHCRVSAVREWFIPLNAFPAPCTLLSAVPLPFMRLVKRHNAYITHKQRYLIQFWHKHFKNLPFTT